MNAEEIHNERRDENKLVHFASVHRPVKALTYLFNRRRGFEGIKRHKSYNLFSVRFCFLYEILRNSIPYFFAGLDQQIVKLPHIVPDKNGIAQKVFEANQCCVQITFPALDTYKVFFTVCADARHAPKANAAIKPSDIIYTVKLMFIIRGPSAHLDGTYIQYFAFAVTNNFADVHSNDR